jgi:predicted lipoprotein with Yx(FWY)xxD motif
MKKGAIPHMKAPSRHRRRRLGALAVSLAAVAILVPVSLAAAPTQVTTAHSNKLGTILANAHGDTLYLFTKDHGKSTCSGTCAKAWPPLLGGTVVAKGGANAHLLTLTTDSDGNRQATYNKHPLYLFSGDHAAGQINGEGANQFGGHWYAVNTAGNQVTPKHSGGSCNPVCSGY